MLIGWLFGFGGWFRIHESRYEILPPALSSDGDEKGAERMSFKSTFKALFAIHPAQDLEVFYKPVRS